MDNKARDFAIPFVLGATLLASLATCHWFIAAVTVFLGACWLVAFDE